MSQSDPGDECGCKTCQEIRRYDLHMAACEAVARLEQRRDGPMTQQELEAGVRFIMEGPGDDT